MEATEALASAAGGYPQDAPSTLGDDRRCGFFIRIAPNNAFEVVDTGSNIVSLDPGSADGYQQIQARGCPGSTRYDWYLDGFTITGAQLTFTLRNDAADVSVEIQKSASLLPGSWEEMIPEVDFTMGSETIDGSVTTRSLQLMTTESRLFFRECLLEAE